MTDLHRKHAEFVDLVADLVKPADWPQDAEWAFTDGERLHFSTNGRFGPAGQDWQAHGNLQPSAGVLRPYEAMRAHRNDVAARQGL